jgi:type I restriction enzyme S subunit
MSQKSSLPQVTRFVSRALMPDTQALRLVEEAFELQTSEVDTWQNLKSAAMRELFARGLRREGQKETEIGLMPKSWEPRTLLSLCEIQSGGTPRKSIAEYWSGTIPWASGKDLKIPTLNDTIDHVSQAGVDAGSRMAPQDAVLLLVRGMGLAKDLPIALISRPMAFNQDLKALVSRGDYSGSYIRSAIYAAKNRLLSKIVPSAHGTMTLNLDDVETFQIPCPPLQSEETSDIVDILDAIDRKIDLHKRKRDVLDELFKSLLHKLMTGEIRVADLDLSALEKSTSAGATA